MPDKVFDPSCPTWKVYEDGAKDVALSALNGINGTRFGLKCWNRYYISRNLAAFVINFFLLLQPQSLHMARRAVGRHLQ